MHVRNTGGPKHGERGSVPDGFDPREAPIFDPEGDNEIVETDLSNDSDEKSHKQGQKKLYRCLYCGDDQKGKSALSIHLTKSSGDEMHPEDASTSDEMYFTVPADENWNPIMEEDTVDEIERRELRDRKISENLPGAEGFADVESSYENDSEDEIMKSHNMCSLTSAEVEQRRQEIVIPKDVNKTEQVAAILTQEERFYDRPEIVTDMIDGSRTTFYEGRKLFDASGGIDVNSREADAAESEPIEPDEESESGTTVEVNGEKFVPFEALQEIADATSEAAEEIISRYQ